jgi:hypothetical protein
VLLADTYVDDEERPNVERELRAVYDVIATRFEWEEKQ